MSWQWTLDLAATALGDGPRGSAPLRAVSTDTRSIERGDLFLALRGENFDGHQFLAQAVERGAAALVVDDAGRAAGLGVPVYVVADTLVALGELAALRRSAWGGPVVGVAGSNGKTTTKELIRAALGSMLDVHATSANLNNRIGVPQTLLALRDEASVAVVEVGTNVPGEVAALRDILRPEIAVVTCVEEEHLEGLGSLAAIFREETAIFHGATVAIAPASQPEIGAEGSRVARRAVSAGLDAGDLRAERWEMSRDGLGRIVVDGVEVMPPLRGVHNLRNTMLALAVARECGVPITSAARGIGEMPLPSMRSSWESLGRATLINDAYNANPGSMRAALDLLSGVGGGRQRVAVLGGMRELGVHASRSHLDVARHALASKLEVIAGLGDMAEALSEAGVGDERVVAAAGMDELWQALEPRLAADAIILLKASRGVKLERLVPHLTKWATS
jgi:UDP-N-acetylmuramoyl-tripeptide--D-alanyl-D-alanine ligase